MQRLNDLAPSLDLSSDYPFPILSPNPLKFFESMGVYPSVGWSLHLED